MLPFATRRRPPRSVAILGSAAGTTARAYGHYFPRRAIDARGDRPRADRRRPAPVRPARARTCTLHAPDARPVAARDAPALRRHLRRRLPPALHPVLPGHARVLRAGARPPDARAACVVVNVGHPSGSDRLERVLATTMGDVFSTVLRDPVAAHQLAAHRRPTRPLGALRLRRRDAPLPARPAARGRSGGAPAGARPCAAGRSTPTTARRSSGSSTRRSCTWRPTATATRYRAVAQVHHAVGEAALVEQLERPSATSSGSERRAAAHHDRVDEAGGARRRARPVIASAGEGWTADADVAVRRGLQPPDWPRGRSRARSASCAVETVSSVRE